MNSENRFTATQRKISGQAASLRWRGHDKAALINTNKGFARKEKNISLRNKNKNLLAYGSPGNHTYS